MYYVHFRQSSAAPSVGTATTVDRVDTSTSNTVFDPFKTAPSTTETQDLVSFSEPATTATGRWSGLASHVLFFAVYAILEALTN